MKQPRVWPMNELRKAIALTNTNSVDPDLAEALAVNELELQDEFIRLASDMSDYNEKLSLAYSEQLFREQAYKKTRASVELDVRMRLEIEYTTGGGKKPTEGMVTTEVENNDDVHDCVEQVLIAKVEVSRLRGVLDAFKTKKDMLVQLGARQRLEIDL